MSKNPNGRNLRGWLTLILAGAVLLVGITIAWAGQQNAIANHEKRITKTETAQTKILDSLARIEGKLGIEPKEIEP